MNIQFKAKLQLAIEKCIEDAADEPSWVHFIHPELSLQMTNAAEAVFDSNQSAQEYAANQTE